MNLTTCEMRLYWLRWRVRYIPGQNSVTEYQKDVIEAIKAPVEKKKKKA
ncbi:hypothetical protein JCM10914A_06610 [Paenibacillus sp. JCM 10914]